MVAGVIGSVILIMLMTGSAFGTVILNLFDKVNCKHNNK